ncbi:MAG: hypothetical protein JXR87_04745, partial [Candidatus Marinimicrobia bacterium]|nr:hypothetical protein [Candidatus Neomarinimicrobiota bacterium]
MHKFWIIFLMVLTVVLVQKCSNDSSKKLAETQKKLATVISLEKDIMPIFKQTCAVCHNRQNQSSPATEHGVYYDTIEDITSEIGKQINPGRPDESNLYNICAREITVSGESLVMPPPGSGIPKWSNSELQKFAKWIAAG